MNHRKRTSILSNTIYDCDEDYEDRTGKRHLFSPVVGFLFIISYFLLFFLVLTIDDQLPTPLLINDEQEHPASFIAERAQQILKKLTDLGPRVVGSYENEVATVAILKSEITEIQKNKHESQEIAMDIQQVGGSYYLEFKPYGAFNTYANVQNVVVRVSSGNNSQHSLLVNAHFDSVPTSPGGSDDGIMCAAMLEILRKLSQAPERPNYNIIFLFNGAEETPLQAAHGFITQHKWAKESKILINLEAAGHGGKEILFQTGPQTPWLLKYYQKVPHPKGQVAGEELFQSNLIPSDTDFRIFRDFGGLKGYDFAFASNGYRYHTKYDDFENIPLGSYQNVGDNILALIRALMAAPEFGENKEYSNNIIYYDFIGLFMVSYNTTIGFIINSSVIILSIYVASKAYFDFAKLSIKYLFLSLVSILAGWFFSGIFVYSLATFLDFTNNTMSWYRTPMLVSIWYCIPIFVINAGSILLFKKCSTKDISYSIKTQISCHMTRLILTFILIIGTCFNIRSCYAIVIPIAANAISFLFIGVTKLQFSIKNWLYMYIISSILPTMTILYQFVLILSLFIPITGRFGSDKNPEIIIGVITLVLTIVLTCLNVPLIFLIRKPGRLLAQVLSFSLISAFILSVSLNRYTGNSTSPSPQRFWIFHTSRTFYHKNMTVINKDAGYFVLNLDRNSPRSILGHVDDFERRQSVAEDCDRALLCGLPLISPRMLSIARESIWIPAEPPQTTTPTSIHLTSITPLSNHTYRYSFTATGPSHLNIYLSPRLGVTLLSTNLARDFPTDPAAIPHWNNRPIYFVNYVTGVVAPLEFTVDLAMAARHDDDDDDSVEFRDAGVVDVAISGKFVHAKVNRNTAEFHRFVGKFPAWADVTSALATYESYVF